MKLFHLLLLSLLLSIPTGCLASVAGQENPNQEEQAGKAPRLSVKGAFLVNPEGEKVTLRGVSYGWHNWWPRFYNPSTVETFQKDWNCTVVRAAMGVEPDGAYLQNPEKALDCITQVADAAIARGIYVIIDWHSHHIRTEEAKDFFSQMATRYKGVPNVIYELFNEPEHDSWADVKAYSIELIKTIRTIDPDALILVGNPHWDQDIHLVADDPIVGYTNIMYTLHFYAATHKQDLRDRGTYALERGIPIFVSECAGMEASGDGPVNVEEWQKWLGWMKDNHISWAAWSVSDKDETCSMMPSTASSTGPWKDADLKDWAKAVRSELKSTSFK